ncbi:DUF4369 domain-containing protein [Streptomyces sp. Ru72]|uniref:DUF4369 domain-containing protein n=1 Tax=Streptomyces sp. Ru72 TaxID=2080747 RepID=UPI000CDDF17E|nr:DUF4369 domain-containing protein [Streptomyces sp. Ru72]POX53415.1 hypothetical protein C3488_05375 [Streptomyces sp. Ru72]
MKSSLRTHSTRVLAAGALSVALLTSAGAAAFAADPVAPNPVAGTSTNAPNLATKPDQPNLKPAVTATTITIRADRTEVKSGQSVTITGQVKGLKAGDRLDLQRYDGRKWATVKTVTVKRGSSSTYALVTKLTGMGKEKLRVVHAKTMSPTVTITVK